MSPAFGLYIVASMFKMSSGSMEPNTDGAAALQQFLVSSQREVGVDDVVAWTLTPSALKSEYNRGKQHYEWAFQSWAGYFEDLATDVCLDGLDGQETGKPGSGTLPPLGGERGRKSRHKGRTTHEGIEYETTRPGVRLPAI
eukprot:CAMPEP_0195152260 /NCGR_PEP_ID=MMETSP0448-20130528/182036_1 /TAXON_ID=66468 /ORGANISM="Heterocapsa triquestra, Strain CCMP 448" /LENGTH=140 /DNA_ID=CAMNT_0040191009 /DNA_START=1 /DNA_END=423 /DNA_ORIENTATION=+